MKAKLVYENINFERGKDPKDALEIGSAHLYKEIVNNTVWNLNLRPNDYNIIQLIPDYMGHPIMVVRSKDAGPWTAESGMGYYGVTDIPRAYAISAHTPYNAEKTVKKKIREYVSKNESLEFERGRDPRASLGVGIIPQIPQLLLKADLDGEYGIEGVPGAIRNIEVIGPRRFMIRLQHVNRPQIRNFSTNKIISKEKYAKHLVEKAGIMPFITNINHQHGTGNNWIFTLDPQYANILPRGKIYTHFDLKESYNFERGQEPYKSIGIGQKEALKRKASEIEWDWEPQWEHKGAEEEIIDLRNYKGYNVKIARLLDPDPDFPDTYAVSDTGEPYMDKPTFYEDPEEAWEYEKHFLDEFSEEQLDPSDHEIII